MLLFSNLIRWVKYTINTNYTYNYYFFDLANSAVKSGSMALRINVTERSKRLWDTIIAEPNSPSWIEWNLCCRMNDAITAIPIRLFKALWTIV